MNAKKLAALLLICLYLFMGSFLYLGAVLLLLGHPAFAELNVQQNALLTALCLFGTVFCFSFAGYHLRNYLRSAKT